MDKIQKWTVALIAGLLFAVVSLPFTYSLTNKLFSVVGIQTVSYDESNITTLGLILHTVVFTLLFRLVLAMYPKQAKSEPQSQ